MNKPEFLKQLELHKDKFSPDVYEELLNLPEEVIENNNHTTGGILEFIPNKNAPLNNVWLSTEEFFKEFDKFVYGKF